MNRRGPRPGMLLDRDGVIVVEKGYLADPELLELVPGAGGAIAELNARGVPVAVVTNQAGIARGFLTEERLQEIHARLDQLLAAEGARVDRYYYCPHHPTAGRGAYLRECDCRKPKPGMLLAAARDLNLDLSQSWLVGDKLTDLEAATAAGCASLLVRTGYGAEDEAQTAGLAVPPRAVMDNVAGAVAYALERLCG